MYNRCLRICAGKKRRWNKHKKNWENGRDKYENKN